MKCLIRTPHQSMLEGRQIQRSPTLRQCRRLPDRAAEEESDRNVRRYASACAPPFSCSHPHSSYETGLPPLYKRIYYHGHGVKTLKDLSEASSH